MNKREIIYFSLIAVGAFMIWFAASQSFPDWRAWILLAGTILVSVASYRNGLGDEREKWEQKIMKVQNPLATFTASKKADGSYMVVDGEGNPHGEFPDIDSASTYCREKVKEIHNG